MLEKFKTLQPKFYREVKEGILNYKKISHAYLIETNSFPKSRELVFAFVKELLCPDKELENHSSENCRVCQQIDNNQYDDLKVIEPDGNYIKKEQLLNLQAEFKMKSYRQTPRVYVIFQAEKLNKSSANTMLKFLEEPENDIIAILVTSNRYQVIDTILSRCQIYSLINDNSSISLHEKEMQNYCLDCLLEIYRMNLKILTRTNEVFSSYFKTKDDYQLLLKQIKYIYLDLLHYHEDEKFLINKYGQAIDIINSEFDLNDIIHKMNVIQYYQERLSYNVNLKLWLDSFLIHFITNDIKVVS